MEFIAAFAHQARGASIMFFLLWSCYLFRFRGDNQMMRCLFISTVCLCLGFFKDSIYLFDWADSNPLIDSMVNIIDMSISLVVCIFFKEVVRPDISRSHKVWIWPLLEWLFIPLYLIFPSRWTLLAAFLYALGFALFTIAYLIFYALKHSQFLESHYSSYEHIVVKWFVVSGILYLVSYIVYIIAFKEATWMGEVVYCLFCQILWTYMILSSIDHKVVEVEDVQQQDNEEDKQYPINIQSVKDMVESKLEKAMCEDKLYLNPTLSLKSVSGSIATNSKYLSIYLNRCLGVTFYDYINSFRVKEACSIIKEMVNGRRINMAEVAEKSGFNSLSSFNRYFRKVKGLTPMEYLKRVVK
ncbi:MAG: helix-turn-helix domain-containing protein [Candidatus Cryptobacteroides sp.]